MDAGTCKIVKARFWPCLPVRSRSLTPLKASSLGRGPVRDNRLRALQARERGRERGREVDLHAELDSLGGEGEEDRRWTPAHVR